MSKVADEQEIREMVLRWADAVHDGDLDRVLATTRRTS